MTITKFIRFELHTREFSPNAIMGIYLDEDNKERKKFLLAPSPHLGKKEGDRIAAIVLNALEESLLTQRLNQYYDRN